MTSVSEHIRAAKAAQKDADERIDAAVNYGKTFDYELAKLNALYGVFREQRATNELLKALLMKGQADG